MANNIYVGGFPYKTTKEDLAKLFSACGTVLSAKVILDRETGRPKGFGFVEMATDAEAKSAVEKLNGAFIGDRKIFVVEGRVDKTRPQGYAPKPDAAKPGFVERRSGKDRRGQPAASDRREAAPPAPSASPAPFAKKPWEKKPFDASKKPWEKKKPFDASGSPKANRPWAKKPFDRKPPARGPKWTPKKD